MVKANQNVSELGRADEAVMVLKRLMEHELAQLNERIGVLIQSHAALIPEIAGYTFDAGGKRLRPILTLACAKLCQYQGNAHIDLAAAVEAIHTATLLHDDVVDASGLRRGRDTACQVWGNKEAILVGDYLFAKAFELMGNSESLEVYQTLSHASVVIAQGEVMQLSPPTDIASAKSYYLDVIEAKTAQLFSAACAVGAIVAGGDKRQCKALAEFGLCLGMAFQMMDDVLDYRADVVRLGKDIGDDFKEGKITLPVIELYLAATDEQKAHLHAHFVEKQSSSLSFTDITAWMGAYHIAGRATAMAEAYARRAQRSLDVFEEGEIKRALLGVLQFVVQRDG